MSSAVLVVFDNSIPADEVNIFLTRHLWDSLDDKKQVEIFKKVERLPSLFLGDENNRLTQALEAMFFGDALLNNRQPTMFIDESTIGVIDVFVGGVSRDVKRELIDFLNKHINKEAFLVFV